MVADNIKLVFVDDSWAFIAPDRENHLRLFDVIARADVRCCSEDALCHHFRLALDLCGADHRTLVRLDLRRRLDIRDLPTPLPPSLS